MADIVTTERLSAKQYNAVAALLSQPSVRTAAEHAGIPERTLYLWLKNPAFIAEYRLARREATNQAIARLQQVAGAAVSVLVNVMVDTKKPAPARISAASKILDLAIKSVELDDLTARLAALEERYAEKL